MKSNILKLQNTSPSGSEQTNGPALVDDTTFKTSNIEIHIPSEIVNYRRGLIRSIRSAIRSFSRNPVSCVQLSLGHALVHMHTPTRTEFLYAASRDPKEVAVHIELADYFAECAANSREQSNVTFDSIAVILPGADYWKEQAGKLPKPDWLQAILQHATAPQDLQNLSDLVCGRVSTFRFKCSEDESVSRIVPRFIGGHGKLNLIDYMKFPILEKYVSAEDEADGCIDLRQFFLMANFENLLPGLSNKLSAK